MTRPARRVVTSLLAPMLALAFVLVPARSASADLLCPATGAAPTVTQVANNAGAATGSTDGGDFVGVQGSGFCGGILAVYFGTAPAASWRVLRDLFMSAIAPSHLAGTVDVVVATRDGLSAVSPADQFSFQTDPAEVYVPVAPRRVLDTRITPQTPNQTIFLGMFAQGVPTIATAVTINVTVTNTLTAGAMTVFDGDGVPPSSSNLNWVTGETVANLVTVGVESVNGEVDFFSWQFGHSDLVVDLEGYFVPSGAGSAGEFVPMAPVRITDTRLGSLEPNAGLTMTPGSTLQVQVTTAGGIPASGVAAVALNVTATDTTAAGYLTVFPTGASRPLASNLNWARAETVPNRVIVPLGTGGKVSIFNGLGDADVVVDVNGYFTDSTASGVFFRLPHPEINFLRPRILDTRYGTGGVSHPLGPASILVVNVAAHGGVPPLGGPASPRAVVLNVTVTDTTAPSALTAWPDGVTRPLASDVNWAAGATRPNLVIVQLGASGAVDLYNNAGSTDVIVDVMAWFG